MPISLPDLDEVPRHVAFIMDGNGRWAKERGLSRVEGHKEGAKSLRAVLRAAHQAGVEYITIYAFSTENWKRPVQEIDGLMELLVHSLDTCEKELHTNRIRLRVMGQNNRLPLPVRSRMQKTVDATVHYADRTFIIAFNYGSKTEITDAVRQVAGKVQTGEIDLNEINEQTVSDHLYLPDVPDPELMIRTSGEMRLSNFLLWQGAYAEFYVTDTLWPDFREAQLFEALKTYGERSRRFGGLDNDGETQHG